MRVLGWTAALAGVTFACWAPAPAVAAPVGDAYYAGTAPGAARPSYVRVSKDGRRLTAYQFVLRTRCSDGVERGFGLNEIREKRFGLTADGRFDHVSGDSRFSAGEGRNRITGRGSVRLTGTFARDTVTMTVRQRFAGRTVCNQDLPLTLSRVGSPPLAGQDTSMATGTFRRTKGDDEGLRIPPFRAIGPARLIENLTIGWTPTCTRGFRFRDQFDFVPLMLTARATLNLPVRDRYPLRGGYRARLRARLTIEFIREIYMAKWAATTKLYRRGRHVSTCRFARTDFGGIVDGA